MAEQSAEFWESGKICACIGFGNMRKTLSQKRLQMRGVNIIEMDKLYGFLKRKNRIYVMTLVSRDKHQIVGYDISFGKSRERIQGLVDRSAKAQQYYSDAYSAYAEVCYEGRHTSLKNKSQTYTVEGVNSDLRHYIPALHRKSKCFFSFYRNRHC